MRALFFGLFLVTLVLPLRSRAELVWVDANGRTIAPLVGDIPYIADPRARVRYLAPDGLVWTMIAETATVRPHGEVSVYFADAECSGPAYVPVVSPRYVFTIRDSSCAWARPDDLRGEVFPVTFVLDGSICVRSAGNYLMLLSKLIEVDPTPPDLDACPPLHVEGAIRSDCAEPLLRRLAESWLRPGLTPGVDAGYHRLVGRSPSTKQGASTTKLASGSRT